MRVQFRLFSPLLALALLSAAPARGQDASGPPTSIEGPPLPERVQSGEPLEPDVRIIRREREIVEEYRLNGRLYMIRVVPAAGPPYYLVDSDGDGRLETQFTELAPGMLIPSWVLFRW